MGFSAFEGADFRFGTPPPGPLEEQLAAWASQAAAARRVACVYLTASWCPPSVLLEKSLTDPLMASALRGVNFATYDIDDSADALQAAGFPAHTVPVFFLLDADGKRSGPSITGAAWAENTPQNMAPPLEAFFDAARAQVVTMPDPQVVAQLLESAAARAPSVAQAERHVIASSVPNAPAPSLMPRVLLVGVILLVLAVLFFAR